MSKSPFYKTGVSNSPCGDQSPLLTVDSPLYKTKEERKADRSSRKTERIERRQERKAGKARVARTKGSNALSNKHLSTEQKQIKALAQRKKYDKKMSKAGDTVWTQGSDGSWYDQGGARSGGSGSNYNP